MNTPQRRMVLDRQYLIDIVSDPGFYAACPGFAGLRDTALQAVKHYKATAGRCCGDNWNLIRPAVDAWVALLKAQHAADPASVEPVRAYLYGKTHSIPRPCVLYYRADFDSRPMKFEF